MHQKFQPIKEIYILKGPPRPSQNPRVRVRSDILTAQAVDLKWLHKSENIFSNGRYLKFFQRIGEGKDGFQRITDSEFAEVWIARNASIHPPAYV